MAGWRLVLPNVEGCCFERAFGCRSRHTAVEFAICFFSWSCVSKVTVLTVLDGSLGLGAKRDGPAFPGKSLDGGDGPRKWGAFCVLDHKWSRRIIMFMSQEWSLGNVLRKLYGARFPWSVAGNWKSLLYPGAAGLVIVSGESIF